jgi:hypothetical protein
MYDADCPYAFTRFLRLCTSRMCASHRFLCHSGYQCSFRHVRQIEHLWAGLPLQDTADGVDARAAPNARYCETCAIDQNCKDFQTIPSCDQQPCTSTLACHVSLLTYGGIVPFNSPHSQTAFVQNRLFSSYGSKFTSRGLIEKQSKYSRCDRGMTCKH